MKNNPLLDKEFLKALDNETQKEIFAKIISLTLEEEPIEQIEGRVTGGSINIDGSSAVRRTCSLTLVAEDVNINDFYWGLSNKFKLYIGLKNTINSNYDDIIWFPQGIFLITSFNTNYSVKSFNISISGKDKMCLLNGDNGGNFPNVIDFSVEHIEDEKGNIIKEKRNIKYIIREMIHYYGNEPFHNIYINDVDDSGLELLEYRGKNDLYILVDENDEYVNILFDGDVVRYTPEGLPVKINNLNSYYSMTPSANNNGVQKIKNTKSILDRTYYKVAKCSYGDAFGYRITELTWPDKEGLIANIGDTITSILDKICQVFGNFEYFYDVEGHFVFQKKLTYINTSWNNIVQNSTISVNDLIQDYSLEKYKDYYELDGVKQLTASGYEKINQYQAEAYIESNKLSSQFSYNFSNSTLVSSFQNTPNFNNLKNDFTIYGKKPAIAENSEGKDIHLRYAIHEKPSLFVNYEGEQFATYDSIYENFKKSPSPSGLSEEWWDLKEWAELYKEYYGEYPSENMDFYVFKEGEYLDLNNLFGINDDDNLYYEVYGFRGDGSWDNYRRYPVTVFDILPNGKLGYTGHNPRCSHPYSWFLERYETYPGYKAYIYSPQIPRNSAIGINLDWREIIYQMAKDYFKHNHDEDFLKVLSNNNPQYRYGKTGYEQYYTDMLAFWRELYNPFLTNQDKDYNLYYPRDTKESTDILGGWRKEYLENPSLLDFWIDFIDSKGTGLSKYSVKAIGDRTKTINDSTIKAIVYSEVPTLIYISREKYDQLKSQNQINTGYSYIIIPDNYQEFFTVSPQRKTTYTELNNLLYNHAYCNEVVSVKTIPIYYLEPNTKITIDDNESNIHGEYIINKINLSLAHNGMMTISASRAPIRLN